MKKKFLLILLFFSLKINILNADEFFGREWSKVYEDDFAIYLVDKTSIEPWGEKYIKFIELVSYKKNNYFPMEENFYPLKFTEEEIVFVMKKYGIWHNIMT